MSRRTQVLLAIGVVVALTGVVGWVGARYTPADPVPVQIGERAMAIRALGLSVNDEQLMKALAQNDAVRQRFGWTTEDEVRTAVLARLRAVSTDDIELTDWFTSHADLFGGRTFAESRTAVDQLVRIEKVRAELEGAP